MDQKWCSNHEIHALFKHGFYLFTEVTLLPHVQTASSGPGKC